VLAVAYLWGYYKAFDIDVLLYAGIWDVIKFALLPIIIVVLTLVPAVLLTGSIETLLCPKTPKENEQRKQQKSEIFDWFANVLLLAITIGALCFTKPLTITGCVVATCVFIFLSKGNVISSTTPRILRFAAFIMIFLPFNMDYIGELKAKGVLKGDTYQYALLHVDNKISKFKYIGEMNNHYFFVSFDNKVVIIACNCYTMIIKKNVVHKIFLF